MSEKLYNAPKDHWLLEPHYSRHVSAMTGEQLFDKSAIAAELAARDREIECLKSELAATSKKVIENVYFCDGPEGHFFTNNLEAARHIVDILDPEKEDWTVTSVKKDWSVIDISQMRTLSNICSYDKKSAVVEIATVLLLSEMKVSEDARKKLLNIATARW